MSIMNRLFIKRPQPKRPEISYLAALAAEARNSRAAVRRESR
jgi:hypothetical protein